MGVGSGFCHQVIFSILQRNGLALCPPIRILVLLPGHQQRLAAGHVIRQGQQIIAAASTVLYQKGIGHRVPLPKGGSRLHILPVPGHSLVQEKLSVEVKSIAT